LLTEKLKNLILNEKDEMIQSNWIVLQMEIAEKFTETKYYKNKVKGFDQNTEKFISGVVDDLKNKFGFETIKVTKG